MSPSHEILVRNFSLKIIKSKLKSIENIEIYILIDNYVKIHHLKNWKII